MSHISQQLPSIYFLNRREGIPGGRGRVLYLTITICPILDLTLKLRPISYSLTLPISMNKQPDQFPEQYPWGLRANDKSTYTHLPQDNLYDFFPGFLLT